MCATSEGGSEASGLSKTGAGNITLSNLDALSVVIVWPPIVQPPVVYLTPRVFTATSRTFTGADGSKPNALVRAQDGSWYGTTANGGTNGAGTIFRLSGEMFSPYFISTHKQSTGEFIDDMNNLPPSDRSAVAPADIWLPFQPNGYLQVSPTFEQLYSFPANDGRPARGSLVFDASGNLYGLTTYGGSRGLGSVWKMTPAGEVTTLHSFTGADGARPVKLILSQDGNLYGLAAGVLPNEVLFLPPDLNFQPHLDFRPVAFDPMAYRTTLFKVSPSGELTTLHIFPADVVPALPPEGNV
ncbi:MAG: hypothetical protein EOP84_29670, partial [Verrucomicrobiaceae bacterium]